MNSPITSKEAQIINTVYLGYEKLCSSVTGVITFVEEIALVIDLFCNSLIRAHSTGWVFYFTSLNLHVHLGNITRQYAT